MVEEALVRMRQLVAVLAERSRDIHVMLHQIEGRGIRAQFDEAAYQRCVISSCSSDRALIEELTPAPKARRVRDA